MLEPLERAYAGFAARAALRRIAKESGELAGILERRIRTGTARAYEPDPPRSAAV